MVGVCFLLCSQCVHCHFIDVFHCVLISLYPLNEPVYYRKCDFQFCFLQKILQLLPERIFYRWHFRSIGKKEGFKASSQIKSVFSVFTPGSAGPVNHRLP